MKKLLSVTFLFCIVATLQLALPQTAKAEYYHKVITIEDRWVNAYERSVVTKQKEFFSTTSVPYAFLKPNRKCKVQIDSYSKTITDVYQCYN